MVGDRVVEAQAALAALLVRKRFLGDKDFGGVVLPFASSGAIDAYVTAGGYDSNWDTDSAANPKVWAAIVFNGVTASGALDYTIRMNATVTPDTSKLVDTLSRAYTAQRITGYVDATLSTTGPPFLRQAGTEEGATAEV